MIRTNSGKRVGSTKSREKKKILGAWEEETGDKNKGVGSFQGEEPWILFIGRFPGRWLE